MRNANIVHVMVEIPANSSVKYELDEKTGRVYVDRFQSSAMVYPENYGMIEDVRGGDGDPADAFVLTSQPMLPGTWIRAKVIGLVLTEDEKGEDPKYICVPENETVDQTTGTWNDIPHVPAARLERIIHFLKHHKELESGKWVKVHDVVHAEEAVKKLHEEKKSRV